MLLLSLFFWHNSTCCAYISWAYNFMHWWKLWRWYISIASKYYNILQIQKRIRLRKEEKITRKELRNRRKINCRTWKKLQNLVLYQGFPLTFLPRFPIFYSFISWITGSFFPPFEKIIAEVKWNLLDTENGGDIFLLVSLPFMHMFMLSFYENWITSYAAMFSWLLQLCL